MIKGKNIVITRSNPVRPDSRVEKEAVSLVQYGYNVMILCWDRDSNHQPTQEKIEICGNNIPIVRFGYKASFGEGFKNIIPYLKFQFAMRSWIKKHKNEISVLHACDFDTAFFTYRLALGMKIKVIFDIFDFLGGERKTLIEKILVSLQYVIIKKSDATIICSEERKNQIVGSTPKRLVVIHNTPSEEQLSQKSDCFIQKNSKIRVSYVGILQDGRLLREIGHFFANNKDLELHIGGFGYLEPYFQELTRHNNNIKYYGRVLYSKTLEIENSCDIMIAIYDPKINNHVFAAPNKFYEALMLGKPLIMVKGTGMSENVNKYDLGEVIDYSEEGFANGLMKLIQRKSDWVAISERMKSIYNSNYSWSIMKERLIGLYNDILG